VIPRRRRRAAWRQAALLALIGVIAAVGVTLFNQRPAHEDDLAIPIGALRSQGFELRLLNDAAARGRDRRFVTAHARQLAQSIERARDELAALQPVPALTAVQGEALRRSLPLSDAAAQLGAGRAPLAPTALAEIVATAERLKALEGALKR